MTGDLPEGHQSKSDLQDVPASVYAAANRAYVDEEGRLGTSAAIRAAVRAGFAAGAAEAARVRADVAEEIAARLELMQIAQEELMQRRQGGQARECAIRARAFRAATDIIREAFVAPAESVVGAPTPVAVASDLDGACHSVWLHGKWRWLTSQMTTSEKEAFADAVDRAGDVLADGEPRLPVDRWWREPVGALPEDEGTRDA